MSLINHYLQIESFAPPDKPWIKSMVGNSFNYPINKVYTFANFKYSGTCFLTAELYPVPSMEHMFFGRIIHFPHLKEGLVGFGFKVNDRFDGMLENSIINRNSHNYNYTASGNLKSTFDDILDISGTKTWFVAFNNSKKLMNASEAPRKTVMVLVFIRYIISADGTVYPNSITTTLSI